MSRQEADLIAVLIYYDSTPFADPFWWNRILGRIPFACSPFDSARR